VKKTKEQQSQKQIRQELHQVLDGALDRVFQKTGYQNDGHFPTFDEREALVSSVSEEISSYLLEKNLVTDPELTKILQAEVYPCPKCQTLSKRVKAKEGKAQEETIMVKTKVGKVPVPAPIFGCAKCRRNFPPLETFIKPQ